jgi:flagellar secretion chaperone FliS
MSLNGSPDHFCGRRTESPSYSLYFLYELKNLSQENISKSDNSFRLARGVYAMANMMGYQAYKKTQIQTADQGSLILMCYDGAVTFLRKAKKAHEEKAFEAWATNILKAQNVIWELTNSLNFEAGEIANNLESIYNYMIRRIIDADVKRATEPLDEVIHYLLELRETWEKIIKKTS